MTATRSRAESRLIANTLLRLGADPRWRIWRSGVGAFTDPTGRLVRVGQVGQSDISGVMLDGTGRRIELEAKSPTGRLTHEQRSWLDLMWRAGAVCGVFRDMEAAVEILESAVNTIPGSRLVAPPWAA